MDGEERWRRLEAIFLRAIELEGAERSAWLTEACAGDDALRGDVEAMIAHDHDSTSGLAGPIVRAASELSSRVESIDEGQTIGPYRILRRLGEGGMGSVFEAEQLAPIRRRVALKVVKAGMDSQAVLDRFDHERQALALMDHPNVARVLDAGTTDAALGSRPYFVMELVPGVSITEHCERDELATSSRVGLCAQICDAVQHAHQKGILHRDLKPSNVLVSTATGGALVKVIDFGIAKALDPAPADGTLTAQGQVVGTPSYMSPEQMTADARGIDTRSDVYSLGVLIHELLTGCLPSSAAGSQALRGELAWIVQRALEHERERRYDSAGALASDLRRHLAGEPVLAGPPSRLYRFRKLVARNKAVAAGSALAATALLAGTIVSVLFAVGQARERARAEQQAAIARATLSFLNDDVLRAASPLSSADRALTVREALDAAATQVAGRFAAQPLVEASIRRALGQTYMNLGVHDSAREHLGRALEIERERANDPVPLVETLSLLGLNDHMAARYAESASALEESVAEARRHIAGDHEATATAAANLGLTYHRMGRNDEAEALLVEAEAMFRRLFGEDDSRVDSVRFTRSQILAGRARYAEAAEIQERLLERGRRVDGPDHPNTLIGMTDLATNYTRLGRFDEAEKLYLEMVERQTRVLGPTHLLRLRSRGILAWYYAQVGRYAEAERLYLDTLALLDREHGPDPPAARPLRGNLSDLYEKMGRHAEAFELARAVIEAAERREGPGHPDAINAVNRVARHLARAGRHREAEQLVAPAIPLARKVWGDESFRVGLLLYRRGTSLAALGAHEEAEPLLIEAQAILASAAGASPASVLEAASALADLYGARGDAAREAEWRARAEPPAKTN